ncbi:IS1 family transposase, partial [Citrobacter werkmanii]|uniref:IS1 family transposase n=1 Tax=Citrobacter werkmanii TaxID=67827 RepID=UPI0021BD2592
GPQNDVTLKMPAFEWVHVQLHQQKGMISLSPPTICNSATSRIQPGSDVIVCAEMDEQWGYVGAKSRQRWLFYAYDRLRKTVVAHVFGERTMATLGRLMSLLSPFDVVIWMTDGWPLYESRLKGKLHVISKRYTQRIERHNLNLRQHLARLGRKSLSFSKSVELHDKVIGHYLNIKHYQ